MVFLTNYPFILRLGNEAADAIKIREGELALGRVRGAPGHLAAETEDFVGEWSLGIEQ